MKPILKKYLPIFAFLLLTGFVHLYANNILKAENSFSFSSAQSTSQIEIDTSTQTTEFNSALKGDSNVFLAEPLENDSRKHKLKAEFTTLFADVTTTFKTQLLSDLALELQKDIFRYKENDIEASQKLYIKFQVFII